MKVNHYMVGDKYTEIETGELFELTSIGTGDMSGRKRLTSKLDGLPLWVTDGEIDHRFQLVT